MESVINVAVFNEMFRKEVDKTLRSTQSPKYTFVKMVAKFEMQYKVEDDGSHGNIAHYTKKLIKNMKYGNIMVYRVLFNGQFFDDGVIHEDLKK